MKTRQRQQDLVDLGGCVKEQDVKALGGSGPKTLFTKQDYFVGAFKRKILHHSRPVRVKYLFSNQRRYSFGTRITDIMTYKRNRLEWKWFKRGCLLTESRFN